MNNKCLWLLLLMVFFCTNLYGAEKIENKSSIERLKNAWSIINTVLQEVQILTTGDGVLSTGFGSSISLSGNRVLIGAPYEKIINTPIGLAYIFEFDGLNWQFVQKLTSDDGEGFDYFGAEVSLSGNTAMIGSINADNPGYKYGAVYVFAFDGDDWVQTQKLKASDASSNAQFGSSVSLQGDRAVIGAFRDDENGFDSGAAYVFEYDGMSWIETEKLIASDGAINDHFASSLSLSSDKVLIGASGHDLVSENFGAAYVFKFNGNSWSEEVKLVANDGASYDGFGTDVSLDGDSALIGASQGDGNEGDSGASYIFSFDGNFWVQNQKLTASDGTSNDRFGATVSLSGNHLLIGAPEDDIRGEYSGSSYVFKNQNQSWSEVYQLVPSETAQDDYFGFSADLQGQYAMVSSIKSDVQAEVQTVFHFNLLIDLIFKEGFEGT